DQWAAVRATFEARISVLTGGPGVGKTETTRAIVAEAEAANATIALCAPTGRAARRLEETTGHEAKTIHRLLEWMAGRGTGVTDRRRPDRRGGPAAGGDDRPRGEDDPPAARVDAGTGTGLPARPSPPG